MTVTDIDPDKLMSNYGAKSYNPEEQKRQWKEHVHNEIKTQMNHPISKSEHFVKKEGLEACLDRKINYYNSEKQYDKNGTYDRLFHQKEGYNPSHKRDDRTYDTNVEEEDVGKPVPTRSSSVYGSRLDKQVEPERSRQHVRCAVVQKDFYRAGLAE
ncbi:uncharacterized protein LOC134822631 [Bolinopsis microptera]|uniref:uncharacterized protein LOC134822631 n=1 Tax=Bolinopsis microptera TaxID=2820187 RepID=UPI003079B4E6